MKNIPFIISLKRRETEDTKQLINQFHHKLHYNVSEGAALDFAKKYFKGFDLPIVEDVDNYKASFVLKLEEVKTYA